MISQAIHSQWLRYPYQPYIVPHTCSGCACYLVPAQALESRLVEVRKELNGDWKKRLDALEEEWQGRLETKQQELEARHKINVQQVG